MRHCVLRHFTEFSPSVRIVCPGYVRQDGAWRWVLTDGAFVPGGAELKHVLGAGAGDGRRWRPDTRQGAYGPWVWGLGIWAGGVNL